MKKVIIVVFLIVAGFAYYRYYQGDWAETDTLEEQNSQAAEEELSIDGLTAIPESCQSVSKSVDNALYGYQTSEVSVAQRNTTVRKFMSCLRDAGLSDAEIDGIMDAKHAKIKRYLEMDGKS